MNNKATLGEGRYCSLSFTLRRCYIVSFDIRITNHSRIAYASILSSSAQYMVIIMQMIYFYMLIYCKTIV